MEGPKVGVGGDGEQAEVDDEGGEVVYMVIIVCCRSPGVLIVLVSQLRASLTAKLGQKHPVVVDQADAPVSLHHDVAVLQVVVGDAQAAQAGGRAPSPLGGDAPESGGLVEP